ncbi:hypothetical protein K438DRAFT_1768379 [Mycena galopus ATCC 62051]|nr:hypothetical protein K438DRAFT_1768379 [Mycena galopus ATCC 62051]
MLKLIQDKLASEASSICVFWMLICNWFWIWFLVYNSRSTDSGLAIDPDLQALAITLQGLQVTSLKIKMVAAKLTASQHRVTNVKTGTSLLSPVRLTRSSRKSGSCAVTAVQKTFSLTLAEVRRIKKADTAKEAECHARCEHYSRRSNKDHYFNVSIGDGSYNSIYLASFFDGDKEEIESIENAAIKLGLGPGVDFHMRLRQDTKITTNLPRGPTDLR